MKAAIALDSWKLPTFKKALDDAKFTYAEEGVGHTIFLTVETDEVNKLKSVIYQANDACKLLMN